MSKKSIGIIVCVIIAMLGVGFLLFTILKDRDVETPEYGSMVKEIPNDEDFVTKPAEVEQSDVEEIEQEEVVLDETHVAEKNNDSTSSYVKGLDDIPDGLASTPGFQDYMNSEYAGLGQTYAYVEEGNSVRGYITGDYNTTVYWVYGAADCWVTIQPSGEPDGAIIDQFGTPW